MAKIKNLNDALVREPETAGAEIQRKSPGGKDTSQASANPKTAGAPPRGENPPVDPFPARQSDAGAAAGKTPRATNTPGE